jgi:P pilus assembly chaperone PapD
MKSVVLSLLVCLAGLTAAPAQNVSLAPSRLYFKASPGEVKKQIVHVTNNSATSQSFTISFGDFAAPNDDGKTQLMKPGESEHSCSGYMSASPSFFEIEPGKTMDVEVVIDLPNLPEANKVKWGTMMLKLAKERSEASDLGSGAVGMGILETFQFIVHIFQTPPSVTLKQAEITSFKETISEKDQKTSLDIVTKNTGEAILDCATYIEFTNLQTGSEERSKPSAFTVLPGGSRLMKFPIPDTLPKGRYTATAVVDIGRKDAVQAAEMDIEIK